MIPTVEKAISELFGTVPENNLKGNYEKTNQTRGRPEGIGPSNERKCNNPKYVKN